MKKKATTTTSRSEPIEGISDHPLVLLSRPHATLASALSVICQWALVWSHHHHYEQPLSPAEDSYVNYASARHIGCFVLSLIKWTCVTLYVVSLNQIYDVELDKVNKKYLPLASGRLSMKTVVRLTLGALFTALTIIYIQHKSFLSTSCPLAFLMLGTLYSLPVFRWKYHATLAATVIFFGRGLLINFSEFENAHTAFAGSSYAAFHFSFYLQDLMILVPMTAIFSLGVAIMKDAPDVKGDAQHGVFTLAAWWGPRAAVNLGSALTMIALWSCFVASVAWHRSLSAVVIAMGLYASVGTHWFLTKFRALNKNDLQAIHGFYIKNMWPLFHYSYVVLSLGSCVQHFVN